MVKSIKQPQDSQERTEEFELRKKLEIQLIDVTIQRNYRVYLKTTPFFTSIIQKANRSKQPKIFTNNF